jgi:hypothetical protein
MVFSGTSEEILKHLCICPDCRKALYQYREKILNEYSSKQTERENFPCEEVSTSDIFDYAIPYGFNPAADQYASFRWSFISHIHHCPACLAKIQQLHNAIFEVAEQAESGIVTTYHIGEPAKTNVIKPDDVYADAGFPISVEVTKHKDEIEVEQTVPAVGTALKRKVSTININSLFKISIAAAAVILVATTLLLNITTAKTITLERIYNAIERVKNVYISSYIPDKKEPERQQWISRPLNINLIKTDKESVLWDIANKIRKVKHLESGSVETMKLTAEMIPEIQNTIMGSLGLVPFHSISEIPKDAEWIYIGGKNPETTNKIEVYDLIWVEKIYEGRFVFKKWRLFVNLETNLPQRVEIYQKSTTDDKYDLRYIIVIKYLDNDEVQKVIKEISF